jgi:predicted Fe-Mo cluster-binding NifX family protein
MRAKNRTSQKSRPRAQDGHSPPPGRKGARAAIPVYRGRVAPVLDTCTQLWVLDSEVRTVPVDCSCLRDRVQSLLNLGVEVIICGAVSAYLGSLLERNQIGLVCGIAGDAEEVVRAYRQGRLHLACFRMPGFRES